MQAQCVDEQAAVGRRRRRRGSGDDVARRAKRAELLVGMGELSSARQALEGADLAPGTNGALQMLFSSSAFTGRAGRQFGVDSTPHVTPHEDSCSPVQGDSVATSPSLFSLSPCTCAGVAVQSTRLATTARHVLGLGFWCEGAVAFESAAARMCREPWRTCDDKCAGSVLDMSDSRRLKVVVDGLVWWVPAGGRHDPRLRSPL